MGNARLIAAAPEMHRLLQFLARADKLTAEHADDEKKAAQEAIELLARIHSGQTVFAVRLNLVYNQDKNRQETELVKDAARLRRPQLLGLS